MSRRSPPQECRISLAVLFLCLATGCCTDPVNGRSYFCLANITDEQEIQIGDQYAPNFIAENGGRYPDDRLQEYLGRIVIDKLAKNSHRPQLPWEFTILNSSQINAFALPGGKLFVTRGRLAKLDSEAQVANLMGHEI